MLWTLLATLGFTAAEDSVRLYERAFAALPQLSLDEHLLWLDINERCQQGKALPSDEPALRLRARFDAACALAVKATGAPERKWSLDPNQWSLDEPEPATTSLTALAWALAVRSHGRLAAGDWDAGIGDAVAAATLARRFSQRGLWVHIFVARHAEAKAIIVLSHHLRAMPVEHRAKFLAAWQALPAWVTLEDALPAERIIGERMLKRRKTRFPPDGGAAEFEGFLQELCPILGADEVRKAAGGDLRKLWKLADESNAFGLRTWETVKLKGKKFAEAADDFARQEREHANPVISKATFISVPGIRRLELVAEVKSAMLRAALTVMSGRRGKLADIIDPSGDGGAFVIRDLPDGGFELEAFVRSEDAAPTVMTFRK